MPRVADPGQFWGEGVIVAWEEVWGVHFSHAVSVDRDSDMIPQPRPDLQTTLQLRWYCAEDLGVPHRPFLVYRRRTPVRFEWTGQFTGPGPRWGRQAVVLPVRSASVEILVEARDQSQPVVAYGFAASATGPALATMDSSLPAGANRVRLVLQAGALDWIVIQNGRDQPSVRFASLADTIEHRAWTLWEIVGVPFPVGNYSGDPQGLAGAETDPESAANRRLEAGLPQVGWMPFTQDGRIAPGFRFADPPSVLAEMSHFVDEALEPVWSVAHDVQKDLPPLVSGEPATQGGVEVQLDTQQSINPLGLLSLAASSDAATSLALGFGTAAVLEGPEAERPHDYLVVAEYDGGATGDVSVAAFIPSPPRHRQLARPVDLHAARMGLNNPPEPDAPWRETNRVDWAPVTGSVALGRPTGSALTRHDANGPDTPHDLTPVAEEGATRHLAMLPERADPTDPVLAGRAVLVDPTLDVAEGDPPSLHHYAVSLVDIYGIWSRWSDTDYLSPGLPEPGPTLTGLDGFASYEGSPQCPTAISADVSVDWSTRTWSEVELHLLCVPEGTSVGTAQPPATPPAGSITRTVRFDPADPANATAGTVTEVDPDTGEDVDAPGAAGEPRQYRVDFDSVVLDFSSVADWELHCWARATRATTTAPSPWVPPIEQVIPSPVPSPPLPPPPPVGVPTGSVPDDSDRRSHVSVQWRLAPGASVESVSIWESSESSVRQEAGLPFNVDPGTAPHERLAELRTAFLSLSAAERRRVFRRLRDVPPDPGTEDVALPRGSTDIHLYVVASRTPKGVESAVPTDWESVQPFMVPRVDRAPSPTLTITLDGGGNATFAIATEAPPTLHGPRGKVATVPVERFLVYRADPDDLDAPVAGFGPPVLEVPAAGTDAFVATATGPIEVSWRPLAFRAVSVPPAAIPIHALKPRPSHPSAVVAIRNQPAAPPELEALSVGFPGPTGRVPRLVAVSSALHALPPGDRGDYQVQAVIDGTVTAWTDLGALSTDEPDATDVAVGAPVVTRGPRRSDGFTPITIWLAQPTASAIPVELRVVDPLGRRVWASVVVAEFDTSPPELTIEQATAGDLFRASVVQISTNLRPADFEDLSLKVVVRRKSRAPLTIVFPPLSRTMRLDEIPVVAGSPRPLRGKIVIARHWRRLRREKSSHFSAWFFASAPFTVRVSLIDPIRGEVAADSDSVRGQPEFPPFQPDLPEFPGLPPDRPPIRPIPPDPPIQPAPPDGRLPAVPPGRQPQPPRGDRFGP